MNMLAGWMGHNTQYIKQQIMTSRRQDKVHMNVIIMSDSEKSGLCSDIIGLSYLSNLYEISSKFNNLCIILTNKLRGLNFEEV